MAEIERLNIALPSKVAETVRQAVEDGEYASASEVVHDALALWATRRALHAQDLETLRRHWDEGKASGRAGKLDIARIIEEERAKLVASGRVSS